MTRYLKTTAIVFAMALGILATTFAQATRPDDSTPQATRASMDIIEHVQKNLKTVGTVEADFDEEKTLAMLNHTLSIRGHLALQKPDWLIWIVKAPVRYAVRIEGDEVRQWDEDTNNVQVIHLGGDPTFKAISEQIQAWFLGNYKALGDSYDVMLLKNDPLTLQFLPRSDTMVSKILKSVDLTFNHDVTYIDSMVIRETGGDTTTIQFLNSKVNQPIAADTWEMPPK
jgi:outer membrane lipoprotein-sorting protein